MLNSLEGQGSSCSGAARLEARQAVGEDLRKHRDDAVGEIDAGSPEAGAAVEVGARADEVRDVGDVDAEAPVALFVARQGDRVVEVARRGGVDRDRQDLAEVEPIADLVLGETP